MVTEIQVLSIIIVFAAILISVIATPIVAAMRNRPRFALRSISAYEVLPDMVSLAIETDDPIQVSTGTVGIGTDGTLIALAGVEIAYQIAQETVVGGRPPIFVTSDTTMVPLGYDTLQRAFRARNQSSNGLVGSSVRWYPSLGGERSFSLVFAAMLTATMYSDNVSGNVFVGGFGAELALPLAASGRKGIASIAGSDDLTGQAIAYAMADGALLGEEVFSGGAYLSGDDRESISFQSGLLAQDILRTLLVLGIIGYALYALLFNGG